MGVSGIPYYCPWEDDVKLLGIDGKSYYIDSNSESIIFIPHPKLYSQFMEKYKIYAEDMHVQPNIILLKKYFSRLEMILKVRNTFVKNQTPNSILNSIAGWD